MRISKNRPVTQRRTQYKKSVAALALIGGVALTGAAHADQDSGLNAWASQADKSVDEVMVYPTFAAKRALSGQTTFRVTVDRSGDVVDSTLTDTSGDIALRSAARRVVSRADFPALPSSFESDKLTFSLRLNYLIAGSAAEAKALERGTEVRGEAVSSGTPIAGRITILSQVAD